MFTLFGFTVIKRSDLNSLRGQLAQASNDQTALREEANRKQRSLELVSADLLCEQEKSRLLCEAADLRSRTLRKYMQGLTDIVGMETPTANATVRRMAKRASDALYPQRATESN